VSGVRNQSSEVGGQIIEDRGQNTEDRCRILKSEGGIFTHSVAFHPLEIAGLELEHYAKK